VSDAVDLAGTLAPMSERIAIQTHPSDDASTIVEIHAGDEPLAFPIPKGAMVGISQKDGRPYVSVYKRLGEAWTEVEGWFVGDKLERRVLH